jgi:hypothetical protein
VASQVEFRISQAPAVAACVFRRGEFLRDLVENLASEVASYSDAVASAKKVAISHCLSTEPDAT